MTKKKVIHLGSLDNPIKGVPICGDTVGTSTFTLDRVTCKECLDIIHVPISATVEKEEAVHFVMPSERMCHLRGGKNTIDRRSVTCMECLSVLSFKYHDSVLTEEGSQKEGKTLGDALRNQDERQKPGGFFSR